VGASQRRCGISPMRCRKSRSDGVSTFQEVPSRWSRSSRTTKATRPVTRGCRAALLRRRLRSAEADRLLHLGARPAIVAAKALLGGGCDRGCRVCTSDSPGSSGSSKATDAVKDPPYASDLRSVRTRGSRSPIERTSMPGLHSAVTVTFRLALVEEQYCQRPGASPRTRVC
jgi:hypothetical protein